MAKTRFEFSPFRAEFCIEHPPFIDAQNIFAQFGEMYVQERESTADCVVHIDSQVQPTDPSVIYPQLISNSVFSDSGEVFESQFDFARVKWHVCGTTEIYLNKLSYEGNPHYLQNLFLKAFRHAFLVKGLLVVHASACSFNQIGAILIGRQNAGKSSFSIITASNGGRVVSDDMLIVGDSNDENLTCRAARRDLVLREKMATGVFGEHIDQFTKTNFYPSNETKYVLPRVNSVLATELSTNINKVLIASNPAAKSSKESVQRISNHESLNLLISEICGQYDATIYKFPTHKRKILSMIERLCRIPSYSYTKSKKFEDNPVKTTLSNWDFLNKDN